MSLERKIQFAEAFVKKLRSENHNELLDDLEVHVNDLLVSLKDASPAEIRNPAIESLRQKLTQSLQIVGGLEGDWSHWILGMLNSLLDKKEIKLYSPRKRKRSEKRTIDSLPTRRPPIPEIRTLETWNTEEVYQWLLLVNPRFERYKDLLEFHTITGQELISSPAEDFINALGIKPVGHKKAMIRSVESIQRLFEVIHWTPNQVATYITYLNPSFRNVATQAMKIGLDGASLVTWSQNDIHKQLHCTTAVAQHLHKAVQSLKEMLPITQIEWDAHSPENNEILAHIAAQGQEKPQTTRNAAEGFHYLFRTLDVDHNGFLSADEFKAFVKKLLPNISGMKLTYVFQQIVGGDMHSEMCVEHLTAFLQADHEDPTCILVKRFLMEIVHRRNTKKTISPERVLSPLKRRASGAIQYNEFAKSLAVDSKRRPNLSISINAPERRFYANDAENNPPLDTPMTHQYTKVQQSPVHLDDAVLLQQTIPHELLGEIVHTLLAFLDLPPPDNTNLEKKNTAFNDAFSYIMYQSTTQHATGFPRSMRSPDYEGPKLGKVPNNQLKDSEIGWLQEGDISQVITYQLCLDRVQLHLDDKELHIKIDHDTGGADTAVVEEWTNEHLQEAFNRFDFDGDGVINFRDLCYTMEELGVKWDIDNAKTAFKKIDMPKTKEIDFEKFCNSKDLDHPDVKKIWDAIHLFIQTMFNPESVTASHLRQLSRAGSRNHSRSMSLTQTFTLPQILETLSERGEDWQERIAMMNQLPGLLDFLDHETYVSQWQNVSEVVISQIRDRRTTIVPVACEMLFELYQNPDRFDIILDSFGSILVSSVFQCIRTKITIIHEAGVEASVKLATELPLDPENLVLNSFIDGTKEKHAAVRKTCYDCIRILVEKTLRDDDPEATYWPLFFDVLTQGITDSDADVRKAVFEACKTLAATDKVQYESMYHNLLPREKKSLDRAMGKKKKRQRLIRKKKKKQKK